MLRNIKDLLGCSLQATDGIIGDLKDFYFDDQCWVVRYLIVDTGTWLSGRKVLVSPIAITGSIAADKVFLSTLTREQVKNSPDIDTDKPVSRQHQLQYLDYGSQPRDRAGVGLAGGIYPSWLTGFETRKNAIEAPWSLAGDNRRVDQINRGANANPHLRSCNAVLHYQVHARDGDIGHLHGMLVDEETWSVRYMIVNTSAWWLGHEVLIAPPWIKNVSWPDRAVTVDLGRQTLKTAPPYDSSLPLEPELELRIFEHYGRELACAGAKVSDR
jgi:hypothetical protein